METDTPVPEAIADLDNLPYDIFGGDSDLSDAEDEAEADERRREVNRAVPGPEEPDDDSDDDDDAPEQHDDQAYAADTPSALKGMKFKRNQREEGQTDDAAPAKRKKKAPAANKQRAPIEEEEEVDEDTRRRRNLASRLDAIVKKPKSKSSGKKKRDGAQDDDLDAMNDEAVVKMRLEMLQAAELDIEENKAGKPAVHKMRMLPAVVEMMQKTSLAESLVENGMLEAVRRWLEPLEDHSLPALNIQRPLFDILRSLSIDTPSLQGSGIGKIVFFYTKCKRVQPSITRAAQHLVGEWMKPIIRRSNAATGKDKRVRAYQPQAPKKVDSKEEGIARRHARIPEQLSTTYSISPAADPRARARQVDGPGPSLLQSSEKFKEYKKKLLAGQQASRRV